MTDGYLIITKEMLDFPFETLEQEKAYAVISSYKDNGCYFSHSQWCEILKCSEPTARKTMRSLQQMGAIDFLQHTQKGTLIWKVSETPLKNLYPTP